MMETTLDLVLIAMFVLGCLAVMSGLLELLGERRG